MFLIFWRLNPFKIITSTSFSLHTFRKEHTLISIALSFYSNFSIFQDFLNIYLLKIKFLLIQNKILMNSMLSKSYCWTFIFFSFLEIIGKTIGYQMQKSLRTKATNSFSWFFLNWSIYQFLCLWSLDLSQLVIKAYCFKKLESFRINSQVIISF